MEHFTWFQLIGVPLEYTHVAEAATAGLLLVILGVIARARLGKGEDAIRPADRFSVRGIFEVIIELFEGLAESVIGKDGRKYVGLSVAIFFFILINNLIGILPGMGAATDNFNTTFGLGIFSFVVYNFYGIRANGWHYLKHFMGPVVLLAPFMLIIELISHLVRPMSLGLRLMGNLKGDHAVLGVFLDLVPIGVPIPFYILGLFVCFMQAFIFTLLSMVYIAMATAHDH